MGKEKKGGRIDHCNFFFKQIKDLKRQDIYENNWSGDGVLYKRFENANYIQRERKLINFINIKVIDIWMPGFFGKVSRSFKEFLFLYNFLN